MSGITLQEFTTEWNFKVDLSVLQAAQEKLYAATKKTETAIKGTSLAIRNQAMAAAGGAGGGGRALAGAGAGGFAFNFNTPAVESATSALTKFRATVAANRDSLMQLQNIGRSMTMFLTVPLTMAAAGMVKLASDANETGSKFRVVFSNMGAAGQQATKELVNNYGLASDESEKLLGSTGDLLTGFGFSQGAALDMSLQVQKLARDLESFTNYEGGVVGASEAITKALLGEREQIKSLGKAILDEDVNARVKQLEAMGQFTNESDRQRKAYATLQLITEQSKNAIGDYARTQEQSANQTRLFIRDVRELALDLGKKLLPVYDKLVSGGRKVVNWFRESSDGTKYFILSVGGLIAVLGPLLVIIPMMIFAINGLTTAYIALGMKAAAAGTTMFGAWVGMFAPLAAGVALVIILGLILEDIWVSLNGGRGLFAEIFETTWFDPIFQKLTNVKELLDSIFGKWGEDPEWMTAINNRVFGAGKYDPATDPRLTGDRSGVGNSTANVSQTANITVQVPAGSMDIGYANQIGDAVGGSLVGVFDRAATDITTAFPATE